MGLFFNFTSFIILTILLFPLVKTLKLNNSESLDTLLRDFALKMIVKNRSHTGILYKASLPQGNLSGIEVSVLRIRSRGLWNKGANFSHLNIPPKTTSLPHVKRLALVYQDFGNWSSQYYTIQGYNLISSVIGFTAFDASNSRVETVDNVTLITLGDPISIRFPNLNLEDGPKSIAKCATFAINGTIYLTEMKSTGLCYSREEGHFSIVVEKIEAFARENKRHWWLSWFVLGFVGLVLLGFSGMVLVRLLKTKKIQIMERQADDDLALSSRWVGPSKMPCAEGTRTLPSLENGCLL